MENGRWLKNQMLGAGIHMDASSKDSEMETREWRTRHQSKRTSQRVQWTVAEQDREPPKNTWLKMDEDALDEEAAAGTKPMTH